MDLLPKSSNVMCSRNSLNSLKFAGYRSTIIPASLQMLLFWCVIFCISLNKGPFAEQNKTGRPTKPKVDEARQCFMR